jgi:hypothetical protein
VAAKAKSASVMRPSAIHLSGSLSIMNLVFASVMGDVLLDAINTPMLGDWFLGLGLLSFIPRSRFK